MNVNWNYPTQVLVGAGRLQELPELCVQHGMQNPLLVTDPGLASLPMVAEALALCRAAGLSVGSFSQIKPNPTGANVKDGIAAFQAGQHDGSKGHVGIAGGIDGSELETPLSRVLHIARDPDGR